MDHQRLRDQVEHPHVWAEAAVRVLGHQLGAATEGHQAGTFERADILTVEQHATCSRRHQSQHGAPEGGLAAAGFADHGEVLASLEGQRHVPNGAHRGRREEASAHEEVDRDALQPEERAHDGPASFAALLDRQHRTRWSAVTAVSGGGSTHCS